MAKKKPKLDNLLQALAEKSKAAAKKNKKGR